VSRCEEHVYKFLLQKKQVRKKLSHQNIWASICTWQFQLNDTYMCQSNQCWRSVLTLWRPAKKGIFGKKHRNTHDFERELLRSCTGYRPGQSVKKRSKSSSLHSKKNFLVGGCGFFMSDVISGGLLSHLGLLYLATNC